MGQKAKQKRAEEIFRQAELKEEQRDLQGAYLKLLEAARLGYALAQSNLGNMLSAGRGTSKNPRRAAYWYRAAFRQGATYAAINLASDLEKQGRIRPAKIWLRRAVLANDGEALVPLAKLYLKHGPAKSAKALLIKASILTPPYLSDRTKDEAKKLLRRIDDKSSRV